MKSYPPESPASSTPANLARLLDRAVRIPGTKIEIGLDPIIGLIPGVGDAIAGALGSLIVLSAMRAGVPKRIMVRMWGNLLLNALLGAVPVAGDIFSVWFQSNTRNYALLRAWQENQTKLPASSQGKWVAGGCVVLLGLAVLSVWLLKVVWQWITG